MITGIDVVFIHTPHKKLADWYTSVLGLKQGYGDDHWQEYEMKTGSRFAMDYTSYPRSVIEKQPVMISFRVDNIEETVELLAEQGVLFYPSKEKTIIDVGPARVATFQDPDGNWLQLSEPNNK